MQKQVAQSASCLGPRDFSRTLKLVQSALASNPIPTRDTPTNETRRSGRLASDSFYESLVQKAELPFPQVTVVGWLKKAERDLTIHCNQQFNAQDQDVKKGVFIWICDVIMDQKVSH